MSETTIVDGSFGIQHLRDCAAEMGIDYLEYRSNEETHKLPSGQEIETWYDEDAFSSLTAWKGWVKGIGSTSGASIEEVIQNMIQKIEKSN